MRLVLLSCWARSMALFIGALGLIDVLGGSVHSRSSLMAWWSSVPAAPGRALSVLGLSALLIAYAWAPRMGWLRRRATQGAVLLMLACCLVDSVRVLALYGRGVVHNPRVMPLSVLLALALAGLLHAVSRGRAHARRGAAWWRLSRSRLHIGRLRSLWVRVPIMAGAGVCAVAFAYGQMVFFGNSDYRRQADAVVVFGARVYRSGRPSLALADRVRTGAALVRNGYAPVLLVSGGPGDGDTHEVEAMRALAIAEGVPASAIVMDRGGVNTRETVRNTSRLLPRRRAARVLAVSHGYHLPRIKLSYQQQGMIAYTVPADETRTLIRLPWYMARESLAFWAHALRFV